MTDDERQLDRPVADRADRPADDLRAAAALVRRARDEAARRGDHGCAAALGALARVLVPPPQSDRRALADATAGRPVGTVTPCRRETVFAGQGTHRG